MGKCCDLFFLTFPFKALYCLGGKCIGIGDEGSYCFIRDFPSITHICLPYFSDQNPPISYLDICYSMIEVIILLLYNERLRDSLNINFLSMCIQVFYLISRTILYISMIYALGNIVVAVTAVPKILEAVKL